MHLKKTVDEGMIGQLDYDQQALTYQHHQHALLCEFQLHCPHTSWLIPCRLF